MDLKFSLSIAVLALCLSLLVEGGAVLDGHSKSIQRILFGSCSKASYPQPLWKHIIDQNPDVFVFAGDNIYADQHIGPGIFRAATPEMIRTQYQIQSGRKLYRDLSSRHNVTVLATWDDHDYGLNDAGREFENKDASQQLFLDFFGVDERSPRRKRRGVYSSFLFSDDGGENNNNNNNQQQNNNKKESSNRSTKIILLDTRYHRGLADVDGGDGDMLGAEQWSWLEDQFVDSVERNVQVNVIVSSIQVLADLRVKGEGWSCFSLSKQRLLSLIRKTGIQGVVFVSGDVHYGEFLQLKPDHIPLSAERRTSSSSSDSPACVSYPLYEITSSGMTHSFSSHIGHLLSDIVLSTHGNSLGMIRPYVE